MTSCTPRRFPQLLGHSDSRTPSSMGSQGRTPGKGGWWGVGSDGYGNEKKWVFGNYAGSHATGLWERGVKANTPVYHLEVELSQGSAFQQKIKHRRRSQDLGI